MTAALRGIPQLPCRAWWLDEPLADTRGRALVPRATAAYERAWFEACWVDGGARVVWWASAPWSPVDGAGALEPPTDAFVVADGATLDALRAVPAARGNAWAVSPDGRWLACADGHFDDGGEFRPGAGYQRCELAVWDLASGDRALRVELGGFLPDAVAFEGDRRVWVGGSEGATEYASGRAAGRHVELATGARSTAPAERPARGVAVLRPRRLAATAEALRRADDVAPRPDGRAWLYAVQPSDAALALALVDDDGVERGRYAHDAAPPQEVVWSRDDRRVAATFLGGAARTWDVATRRDAGRCAGGFAGFLPDGGLATVRAEDGALVARAAGAAPWVLRGVGGRWKHWTLDGTRLAVADDDGLAVWDVVERRVVATIAARGALHVACEARVALAYEAVDRYRVVTPAGARQVTLQSAWIGDALALSADGAWVAEADGPGKTVALRDVATGETRWRVPLPGAARGASCVAFCAARRAVSAAYPTSQSAVALLLDVDDGAPLGWVPLAREWALARPAWSHDGRRLATAHAGGRVCVRDVGPSPHG